MKNLTPPKNHFSRRFGPWGVRICKNLEIENFWFRNRQKWLSPRSLKGWLGEKPNTPQKPLFSTFWTVGIIFKQKKFFRKKFFFVPPGVHPGGYHGSGTRNEPFLLKNHFSRRFGPWGVRICRKKNFEKSTKPKGGPFSNEKGPPFGFWPKKIFSIFFHGNFFFHGGYFGHRPTSNP